MNAESARKLSIRYKEDLIEKHLADTKLKFEEYIKESALEGNLYTNIGCLRPLYPLIRDWLLSSGYKTYSVAILGDSYLVEVSWGLDND